MKRLSGASTDYGRGAGAVFDRSNNHVCYVEAVATVALILLALLSADSARAMSVSPTEIEMTSVGGKSRAQIAVTNDGDVPLPVETILNQLSLSEAGDRTLTEAGNEFLVFPPQAMIAPGETQVFRLQWVGEPEIAASKSYLMSVSQVPVKFKNKRSEVQVVVGLGVVINVAPPSGTSLLRVVSASVVQDSNGHRRPTIAVKNSGAVHALLSQATIEVSGNGWSILLPAAEFRERLGMGLVQPGKIRSFVLPLTVPDSAENIAATLTYKPKR